MGMMSCPVPLRAQLPGGHRRQPDDGGTNGTDRHGHEAEAQHPHPSPLGEARVTMPRFEVRLEGRPGRDRTAEWTETVHVLDAPNRDTAVEWARAERRRARPAMGLGHIKEQVRPVSVRMVG